MGDTSQPRHEQLRERLAFFGFTFVEYFYFFEGERWEQAGAEAVLLAVKPGASFYDDINAAAERILAPFERAYALGQLGERPHDPMCPMALSNAAPCKCIEYRRVRADHDSRWGLDVDTLVTEAYNRGLIEGKAGAHATGHGELPPDEKHACRPDTRRHRHEEVRERLELLGFVKNETLTGNENFRAEVWELGQTTVVLRVKPGVRDYEEYCDEAERLLAPYEQVYSLGLGRAAEMAELNDALSDFEAGKQKERERITIAVNALRALPNPAWVKTVDVLTVVNGKQTASEPPVPFARIHSEQEDDEE